MSCVGSMKSACTFVGEVALISKRCRMRIRCLGNRSTMIAWSSRTNERENERTYGYLCMQLRLLSYLVFCVLAVLLPAHCTFNYVQVDLLPLGTDAVCEFQSQPYCTRFRRVDRERMISKSTITCSTLTVATHLTLSNRPHPLYLSSFSRSGSRTGSVEQLSVSSLRSSMQSHPG
jgi:hypothetical protein